MNAKLVSAFIDSTIEVLSMETGADVTRGQVSMEESQYATDDVNVHLAIVGRLEGAVLYAMSRETALKIVSGMIGQEMTVLDDLAQSGVAELGNVITGRTSTVLAEMGYHIQISVPTLVMGKGATISILDYRRLVVPVLCEYGEIGVHVALREVPS
jgi:chemotaxis protein CheX